MISKNRASELKKLESFPKLKPLKQLPKFIFDPVPFSNLVFALMIIKKF